MRAEIELVTATVVYLSPQGRHVVPVRVPVGSRLIDAVRASGILRVAGLEGAALDLGVFNRVRDASEPVHEGDRIEIYRPLSIDPKEARRVRAEVRRRRRAARA